MAKSAVSDEEIQLRKRARRRLVGAIALVVLVVAAVPMILDSEPRQRPQQIDVRVPPLPLRPPNPLPPAPVVQQPPAAPAPDYSTPATPATVPPARLPEPPPLPAAAPPTRAAAAKPSGSNGARNEKTAPVASGAEAYAVALIATASTTRAAELKRELQRLKFPAYTQATPDGEKTRVRVGPFASREAAEQARQRLIRQGYDPGKVVRKGE